MSVGSRGCVPRRGMWKKGPEAAKTWQWWSRTRFPRVSSDTGRTGQIAGATRLYHGHLPHSTPRELSCLG